MILIILSIILINKTNSIASYNVKIIKKFFNILKIKLIL